MVDVFCGNYTLVDWDVHALWTRGFSVGEAAAALADKGDLGAEYPGVTLDLIASDVDDQFKLFAMLESVILTVGNLSEQCLYQLDADTQSRLVERYYGLDDAFCRELLGKKLSSRVRKDLDEISEKTGINLKTCRRQFDNIRRVFKAMEELPGRFVPNIVKVFSLSTELAERYAAIVFLTCFRIELSKKRLNFLTFEAVKNVCLLLMDNWTDGDDWDREFLGSLKELKVLVDRDKEHRNVVCSRLKEIPELVSPRVLADLEMGFKLLTRNMLSFGLGGKDIREFFVVVVEKVVEPLKQMRLERSEVEQFLRAYTEATPMLEDDGRRTSMLLSRYMSTLGPCILAIY